MPSKTKRPDRDASSEIEEGRSPIYAAPALDKGLDIIELLAKQERGLTRREIADRLDRSVGEIFRMIEALTRRGYLVQGGDEFLLGMKLFELAHAFPPMSRLLKEALPRMETLSKSVDQSCHLSVLSGPRQLVIAQVDTPGGVGFSVKIGATLDLLKSASGRVLLAFQEKQEAQRLIALADPNATELERNDALKSITEVAAQGYAFIKSNQFSGVEAISYPIFNLHGHAIAALTVPYVTRLDDSSRKPASATQAVLADIAAELNAVLGGSVADAGVEREGTVRSRRSGIRENK